MVKTPMAGVRPAEGLCWQARPPALWVLELLLAPIRESVDGV